MQATMTLEDLEAELMAIDREWEALREAYRPGAFDNKVDELGYPTEQTTLDNFEQRVRLVFGDLDLYSQNLDVRDLYDNVRASFFFFFKATFENLMGLGMDHPFMARKLEHPYQRNLYFGQLAVFAKTQSAPEAFHDGEDGSMLAVEKLFEYAEKELSPCDVTFIALVKEVFYPLFKQHALAYNSVPYYHRGLPSFFQSVEAALIVIDSPALDQGGAYYDWIDKRRNEHAMWNRMKVRNFNQSRGYGNWRPLVDAYEKRLATHDIVLNDRRVQAAAAIAARHPSRTAAIVVLQALRKQVALTARGFWEAFGLRYRQWCHGTPRYAAPSTPELERADAAAVLAEEVKDIMSRFGTDPVVQRLAEPLIWQLHHPSSALSFRETRQWDAWATEQMEEEKRADESRETRWWRRDGGGKRLKTTKSLIAVALAVGDAPMPPPRARHPLEAPALVAATGRVLPRRGSVVDSAFAAHARARACNTV